MPLAVASALASQGPPSLIEHDDPVDGVDSGCRDITEGMS
jgi:hypothetical protein